jgi:DNA-binding response OmpR family regulator
VKDLLVVEDDAVIGSTLREALAAQGYQAAVDFSRGYLAAEQAGSQALVGSSES